MIEFIEHLGNFAGDVRTFLTSTVNFFARQLHSTNQTNVTPGTAIVEKPTETAPAATPIAVKSTEFANGAEILLKRLFKINSFERIKRLSEIELKEILSVAQIDYSKMCDQPQNNENSRQLLIEIVENLYVKHHDSMCFTQISPELAKILIKEITSKSKIISFSTPEIINIFNKVNYEPFMKKIFFANPLDYHIELCNKLEKLFEFLQKLLPVVEETACTEKSTLNDIDNLSIKQLKDILAERGITDFSNFKEKLDFIAAVQS